MTPPPRVRALVVDDELLARQRVLALLASEPAVEVIGEVDGGSAAVEAISRLRPDLVFLDVQMPGLDGFGVLRCTARAHIPIVIFVTAHDEHAIRAFDVQAVDYLLKPVVAARFREAVRRAVVRAQGASRADNAASIETLLTQVAAPPADGPRISVRQHGRTMLVPIATIDWVEADRDHVHVHAGTESYTLRGTTAELEAQLPRDAFVRVHRSIIVNASRVRQVEHVAGGGYVLVLHDGRQLRAGRTYHEAVQAMLRRGPP